MVVTSTLRCRWRKWSGKKCPTLLTRPTHSDGPITNSERPNRLSFNPDYPDVGLARAARDAQSRAAEAQRERQRGPLLGQVRVEPQGLAVAPHATETHHR